MNTDRLNELATEIQKEINRTVNNHVILGTYMDAAAVEMLRTAKKLIESAITRSLPDEM